MRRRTFVKVTASATVAFLASGTIEAKEGSTMAADTSATPGPGRKLPPFMPRDYTVHHLACLHACIDQLGVTLDTAWVYGVTGYAFMINVSRPAMVAGPSWWNFPCIHERTPNFGIDCSEFVYSVSDAADFPEKKKQAIALAKRCCDEGVPAYSAEFGFPECFTIAGYNDEGLLGNSRCFRNANPHLFTWESLGVADAGVLIVAAVKKHPDPPDDVKAIADALRFALAVGHAETGYLGGDAVGLAAYDAWIGKTREKLASGGPVSHPEGADHNTECWWECRLYAPQFLRRASEKTTGVLSRQLALAAERYDRVLEAMDGVRSTCRYYMPPEVVSKELLERTIRYLGEAKDAESKGLDILEEISKAL